MAKRKSKKTTQYAKQRKRITNYIGKLKRKGLDVSLYFPTELQLRKQGVKGKELTALTKVLKTITPEYLKSIAKEPEYIPTNEPDFLPETNINTDDTFFDQTTIAQYKEHVRGFNEVCSNLLLGWLDRIITSNGAHDTAIMLNKGAEAGYIVTYQIAYDRDKLMGYISAMMNYLPEAGTLFKEEMMDAFEQEEDYNPTI